MGERDPPSRGICFDPDEDLLEGTGLLLGLSFSPGADSSLLKIGGLAELLLCSSKYFWMASKAELSLFNCSEIASAC